MPKALLPLTTTLCLVVLLLFALTGSAVATTTNPAPSVSPPNPVAGDTIAVQGVTSECPNSVYGPDTFTLTLHNTNGTDTVVSSGPASSSAGYSTTVPQAGSYTITQDYQCGGGSRPSGSPYSRDFTVGTGLGGSISVSPDPPVTGQQATLAAAATGGNPGYTFSWDLNNDGTFGDATTRTVPYTFTTSGPHTVSVRITDTGQGGNPTHTTTVSRTINVVNPATSTTTTTTTTTTSPPPCLHRVAFKLSEFTTTGCFDQTSSSPQQWTTTSAVKLNGITLPDYGQTFTITGPTTAEPGGHFTAPNSTLQLDSFTAYSGNIDWTLPDGGPGQEMAIPGASFAVASGATLLGLNVRGSIALQLGEQADGTYYADFPLNIQLPAGFTAGPDPSLGSVTGSASLRVDDAGVHYNGLKLQAQDVWLGKIKVHSVCFSYIPSGGMSTTPCDAPSFGGSGGPIAQVGGDQPFIDCPTDPSANRWDASAEIELPSGVQLGAFGGLTGDQVSKLGASVNNLGRRVPLADGLYLDHVAFGLCLHPSPFKVKANVGVNFLGASNFVNIDGSFTYTDAYQFNPWSLELDGSVSIGEAPDALPIGSGNLGVNGNGVIDFGLQAGVDVLGGFASLSAKVYGWIDAPNQQFVVGGEGQGCIAGSCATAEGELSSTGVAGCVTVGRSLPSYNLIIPLDGSRVHLDTSTYPLTAGFGYDWGASTAHLLGGSCDFSAYEPAAFVSRGAREASTGLRVQVARGTQAVALRIHGSHGVPNVVLHGPRGATVSLPTGSRAKLSRGHFLIAANKTDGTMNVMLVRPAAGTWAIVPARGATSTPTKLDRASLQAPATVAARVLGRGGVRTVRVAYAAPAGTTVRLQERAKGVNHTITRRLRGRRCAGLPAMRPGSSQRILCATLRFRPSEGTGGTRKIEAIVLRHGIPLLQKTVAYFKVPRLTVPSSIKLLRAQRGRGSVLLAFSPSRSAAHYSVSAKLSSGPERSYFVGAQCRALRIGSVAAGVSAAIKVAGVRYDLVTGRSRSLTLKSNARSAGVSSRKLRIGKICR